MYLPAWRYAWRQICRFLPVPCIPMKMKSVQFVGLLLFLVFVTFFFSKTEKPAFSTDIIEKLQKLERAIDTHNSLQHELKRLLLDKGVLFQAIPQKTIHIPVLVIACNRVGIKRTLDTLLTYRNSVGYLSESSFPITVSHGCVHAQTAHVLASYGKSISIINFADSPSTPVRNLTKHQLPYRAVAHHYKFALDHMLFTQNHSALIVVEDDLNIAPDFFDYFAATLPVLKSDPTLFCVSAWNDNGRPELINPLRTDLIYRSDFFAGLGWMLLREFWMEIRDHWPDVYWDEFIRLPMIRKERACLRPEVSRTTTFGRHGISRGQFFDKYMKPMVLNQVKYDFLNSDLDHLKHEVYTQAWYQTVYDEAVLVSLDDFLADRLPHVELAPNLRVTYTSLAEFRKIARHLNLMEDIKSGVMRNAFRGTVPLTWKRHTLFVAPQRDWSGYYVD